MGLIITQRFSCSWCGSLSINRTNAQGPVARSLVSTIRWLRGIKRLGLQKSAKDRFVVKLISLTYNLFLFQDSSGLGIPLFLTSVLVSFSQLCSFSIHFCFHAWNGLQFHNIFFSPQNDEIFTAANFTDSYPMQRSFKSSIGRSFTILTSILKIGGTSL